MPPKKRAAVSLDDVAIDFSGVVKKSDESGEAEGLASAQLLLGETSDKGTSYHHHHQQDSLVKAFDPSLVAYVQRSSSGVAGGHRRRATAFGGPSQHLVALQQQQQRLVQQQEDDKKRQYGRPAREHGNADGSATAAEESTPIDFAALRAQQASAATGFLVSANAPLVPTDHADAGGAASGSASAMAKVLAEKREAYEEALRTFCQAGLPWASPSVAGTGNASPPPEQQQQQQQQHSAFPCSLSTGQSNSLLCQLFADGVPDIEPWDRWAFQLPRYDLTALVVKPSAPASAAKDVCDLLHHPVLAQSDYTLRYQHAAALAPVEATLYKTKDELKAERRERLKRKQEEKRKAAAQAAKDGGLSITDATDGSGGLFVNKTTALAHDRLSNRNLVHNLLGSSILNPIAAEAKVLDQYEQRFLEHQKRNHDRHVAALPNQIAKREKRVLRQATEHPVLRAYRIFPIYGQSHLGKLRTFANDHHLRGFVLWVAGCDALIVLAGGEVAARHLDHWILHKMEWESRETSASRLCSVPLHDAKSFSFHLKRLAQGKGGEREWGSDEDGGGPRGKRGRPGNENDGESAEEGAEPVYIKQCATVQEAEVFLRQLPVESPWPNLAAVWRAAFLASGLSQ